MSNTPLISPIVRSPVDAPSETADVITDAAYSMRENAATGTRHRAARVADRTGA